MAGHPAGSSGHRYLKRPAAAGWPALHSAAAPQDESLTHLLTGQLPRATASPSCTTPAPAPPAPPAALASASPASNPSPGPPSPSAACCSSRAPSTAASSQQRRYAQQASSQEVQTGSTRATWQPSAAYTAASCSPAPLASAAAPARSASCRQDQRHSARSSAPPPSTCGWSGRGAGLGAGHGLPGRGHQPFWQLLARDELAGHKTCDQAGAAAATSSASPACTHLRGQVLRLLPRRVQPIRCLCRRPQRQRAVHAAAAQAGRAPGLPHRLAQLARLCHAACTQRGRQTGTLQRSLHCRLAEVGPGMSRSRQAGIAPAHRPPLALPAPAPARSRRKRRAASRSSSLASSACSALCCRLGASGSSSVTSATASRQAGRGRQVAGFLQGRLQGFGRGGWSKRL